MEVQLCVIASSERQFFLQMLAGNNLNDMRARTDIPGSPTGEARPGNRSQADPTGRPVSPVSVRRVVQRSETSAASSSLAGSSSHTRAAVLTPAQDSARPVYRSGATRLSSRPPRMTMGPPIETWAGYEPIIRPTQRPAVAKRGSMLLEQELGMKGKGKGGAQEAGSRPSSRPPADPSSPGEERPQWEDRSRTPHNRAPRAWRPRPNQ